MISIDSKVIALVYQSITHKYDIRNFFCQSVGRF